MSLDLSRIQRILVLRTDRVGDVVLSTPVFEALRAAFPQARLAALVCPYTAGIVEGNPYLNEVILYDKDGAHRSVWATVEFARDLRRRHFDMALVLHPTNRSHWLVRLAGIPIRVGYRRKLGEQLLTHTIEDEKHLGYKHERDYNFDLLKAIGIQQTSQRLLVPFSALDTRTVSGLLESVPADRPLIAFHTGASCPSKRWMPERFAQAAVQLHRRFGATIAVVGTLEDRAAAALITRYLPGHSLDLTGQLNLKQLAALLKRSRLLISNDSGPVHIASAVGTPVIDIFGRNQAGLSPQRWGPTGPQDVVIHKEVGCEICLAHNCQIQFKCLTEVHVADIVGAAEKFSARITG